MSQTSSCAPLFFGRNTSSPTTGTTLSASSSEAATAAITAAASGWYMRPSIPDMPKSGRKTAITMTVAKAIGRPTSVAARTAISLWCSRAVPVSR